MGTGLKLTKDDNIVRISLFDKKTWEIGAIKLNNRRSIISSQTSEKPCSNKDNQSDMFDKTDAEGIDFTPESNDFGLTPQSQNNTNMGLSNSFHIGKLLNNSMNLVSSNNKMKRNTIVHTH